MPATNAKTESDSFSAEERAAMKRVASCAPQDGRQEETACRRSWTASGKWRGSCASSARASDGNAPARVVVDLVRDATRERGRQRTSSSSERGKFSYRYWTLGFQDAANLDDGDVSPCRYALNSWTPSVVKTVAELVKAAIPDRAATAAAPASSSGAAARRLRLRLAVTPTVPQLERSLAPGHGRRPRDPGTSDLHVCARSGRSRTGHRRATCGHAIGGITATACRP